ncbi:MAG: hypothetical protein U0794_05870 [Isosphaeraceae bacterium]
MRLRVRTLMIIVGVVALVLGAIAGIGVERQRAYYRSRAELLAWGEAEVVERIAERLQAAREAEARGPEGRADAEAARNEAEWLARVAAWHVKMEQSYMRSAEHPWEPRMTDPPPPPAPVKSRTPSS